MVDTVGSTSVNSLDRRGSRTQRIAELEAASFLADLENYVEDEQVHEIMAKQPQFPSLNELLADFDVSPQQDPTEPPSEATLAGEGFDPKHVSKSPRVQSCEDIHMVNGVDDLTTPTPPPTPPTIEPYVTQKILSAPEYDAYTLALFEHTPNLWVRKDTRNTALGMWATPGRDNQDPVT
jgi:hypothetical protein